MTYFGSYFGPWFGVRIKALFVALARLSKAAGRGLSISTPREASVVEGVPRLRASLRAVARRPEKVMGAALEHPSVVSSEDRVFLIKASPR